jgi:hypothetical protein
MTSQTKNWIIGILILIVLTGVFFLGYSRYPIWKPCPTTTSDTIYKIDTIIHYIPDSIPFYITKIDSVIYHDTVFKDVDTAAILKDYYAWHYYTRNWDDTLLSVTLKDVISENKVIDHEFTYKIVRPQVVVNNVTNITNYLKYLYLGGGITLPDSKYSNFGVYGAFPRTLIGLGYIPFSPGVNITLGFKIAKFK